MLATTESTETMSFSEVSTLLWQEREAVELLLFKLVEEQLVVSAGQTRWLPRANDEVDRAVRQLRGTEVLRAAEVDALSAELGRGDAITLAELADAAPEPWSVVLAEHRDALIKLVVQIEHACDENRTLLAAGLRSIRETLLSLTQTVNTYDARGLTNVSSIRPVIVDEQV
jgi:hypothetical protein